MKIFSMMKRRKMELLYKSEIIDTLLNGWSYSSVFNEYNIKSRGITENWKRDYLARTIWKSDMCNNKANEVTDYDMVKKYDAQLMKICSK